MNQEIRLPLALWLGLAFFVPGAIIAGAAHFLFDHNRMWEYAGGLLTVPGGLLIIVGLWQREGVEGLRWKDVLLCGKVAAMIVRLRFIRRMANLKNYIRALNMLR